MQKQLPNNLILRSLSEGHASDKANLPAFYVDVFTSQYGPEDEVMAPWTEDLTSGQHPTVTDEDVWVIVDPAQEDRIVSALLLIPQVWRYEAIDIPVGRIELVATHKDYRRQGLIRVLMDVAHERSAALGHKLQVITGIPHYYRQFGYAMALNLGADSMLPFTAIAPLEEDKQPQFTLRPATIEDIPNLAQWYDDHARQSLISVIRTPERWRYELTGRQPQTPPTVNYHIILNKDGLPVGYVGTGDIIWGKRFGIWDFLVGDQTSFLDTFEDVMRGLKSYTDTKYPENERPHYFAFDNGMHPAVKTMIHKTYPGRSNWRSYAWYVRTPNLPQLICDLAPVLERRLEGSGAHRFSGDLSINFQDKTGLQMKFEQGRLLEANPLPPDFKDDDAAFPWHSFLNVVFGHRTSEELGHVLPEVYANRKATVLLEALFPVKRSWVLGVF